MELGAPHFQLEGNYLLGDVKRRWWRDGSGWSSVYSPIARKLQEVGTWDWIRAMNRIGRKVEKLNPGRMGCFPFSNSAKT